MTPFDNSLSYRYNIIKRLIMEKYPHRVIVRLTTAQQNKLNELAKGFSVSKVIRRLIEDVRDISEDKS